MLVLHNECSVVGFFFVCVCVSAVLQKGLWSISTLYTLQNFWTAKQLNSSIRLQLLGMYLEGQRRSHRGSICTRLLPASPACQTGLHLEPSVSRPHHRHRPAHTPPAGLLAHRPAGERGNAAAAVVSFVNCTR